MFDNPCSITNPPLALYAYTGAVYGALMSTCGFGVTGGFNTGGMNIFPDNVLPNCDIYILYKHYSVLKVFIILGWFALSRYIILARV